VPLRTFSNILDFLSDRQTENKMVNLSTYIGELQNHDNKLNVYSTLRTKIFKIIESNVLLDFKSFLISTLRWLHYGKFNLIDLNIFDEGKLLKMS
jgi:hypothetical protein